MIRAFIVEDERDALENLIILLERYTTNVEAIGSLRSLDTFQERIEEVQPDLLFLDINLKEKTVFEGLKLLQKLPIIIFVTGHRDYGIEAIKFGAIDYLLKPINPYELQEAIIKVEERLRKNSLVGQVERREAEKITLRSKLGFEVENIDEITHLQADSNYTHVHFLEKKSITVPYTLKRFEEVLSQEKFIRVHHSYLVNLAHILSFDSQNNLLLLKGDIEVSVSRRKKQMLKDLLRF